jgi:hypothetical protein
MYRYKEAKLQLENSSGASGVKQSLTGPGGPKSLGDFKGLGPEKMAASNQKTIGKAIEMLRLFS